MGNNDLFEEFSYSFINFDKVVGCRSAAVVYLTIVRGERCVFGVVFLGVVAFYGHPCDNLIH